MGKLTFIIPCYNELHHTKRCVESIVAEMPPEGINFVFVDNGSTDGTYDFLKEVPNAHTIRNEQNIYVNPAWNQGLKYVVDNELGDYVCLCNNDIVAGYKWTHAILELFAERRHEFYAPMSNTQESPAFGGEDEFRVYARSAWSRPLELRPIRQSFIGFCMFFRREHIRHFYPVPEQMKVLRGDDWIIDNLYFNSVFPFRVSRCAAFHFGGATQRGMPIHDLRNQDSDAFDELCRTLYRERGMGRIHEGRVRMLLL